jgi:predicted nucleotidyltransferase
MDKKLLFGLPAATLKKIRSVLRAHSKIQEALVYGSRAKGNYRPGSDIDIVLVGGELSLTDLLRIETELDDLLLPYKIDLSLLQEIESKDLLEHIGRVGKRLYPV